MISSPGAPDRRIVSATSESRNTTLFRPEVLEQQQSQWLGPVLLAPRLSRTLFAGFAALAAFAVIVFLFTGTYTRKERVNGWLVPDLGVARVIAPRTGVVSEILVNEGAKVKKGAPLLKLSSEIKTAAYGTTRKEIVRQIEARRNSMAAMRGIQTRILEERKSALLQRAGALVEEQRSLDIEIGYQREKLSLAGATLKDVTSLSAEGFVSMQRKRIAQRDKIDQAANLQSLMRTQSALNREHLQIGAEIKAGPFLQKSQLAGIDRSVATLEEQLAIAEAERQIVITAPQSGTVTSIQTEPGGAANPTVPLLSIVPDGAVLQAHLYSPSRAIGFIHSGQKVQIRYHAFPYQKFGLYNGTVLSVSQVALSPAELPKQLAGLTGILGANEPIYRIIVDLKRQAALAYGQSAPLYAGMRLEADLIIETRTLIEWVFDPLYTLAGR